MEFMPDEYREELAKRKGFKSYKEYYRFLIARRKEKLEEIGKSMEKEKEKPPEEILKKDKKVEKLVRKIEERSKKIEKKEEKRIELEMIKKEAPKIQETIKFLPPRELSKIPIWPIRIVTWKLDRFESLTNLFQKKVQECSLYKITRDIIELEDLTRDIDKNIKIVPRESLIKYHILLGKHENSIKLLEKKCKCKPKN